jgi:folate-binding protein YgfZ
MTPDYDAALTRAALFDVQTRPVGLTGPDAAQFLHNICTNDVKGLPIGGGCEAFLCDARAKALFVLWVMRTADGLVVNTTPGRADALLTHLDRFLIAERVELAVSGDQMVFHLAGPAAAGLVGVEGLAEFQHAEGTVGGTPARMHRHDRLGVPGFDLIVPRAAEDAVAQSLLAAGAATGDGAYDTLRIEAGTPVYGVDYDATRFVMEVGGAARAVSYTKGCFPGQEPIVMARDRAGRVNRQFLGLRGLSETLPPVGAKLARDGKEVGLVTSATQSPRLGAPLALGYVHWQHVERGTRLDADGVPVEVLGYPPLAPGS